MKKFIVLAIAALSLNAFADHHQKSMVTLSGYEGGQSDRSVDLGNLTGGNGANKHGISNIALNYAYTLTDTIQVGASYKNFRQEIGGQVDSQDITSAKTFGLQAIYNFAGKLTDTSYAALHYDMKTTTASNNKTNTWGVEYGHRFNMGTVMGLNFNYSPSATIAVAKTTAAASGVDDSSTTNFSLNFVKFDVLF